MTDLHDRVAAGLAAMDQRYTRNRRALVEALAGAGRPLTIPAIVERDARLPLSTVYRNVSVLESAGIVRRVPGAGEHGLYELAEHLTGHHHHLVCRSCGTVEDVELPDRLEKVIHSAAEQIASVSGFTPDSHSLDFVGICATCDSA